MADMKKQTRLLFFLALVSLASAWVLLHRQNEQLRRELPVAGETP
jgi:hypothetical protein